MHELGASMHDERRLLERRVFDLRQGDAIARDVTLVFVVALALGLIRHGAPSVWVDEAFTARAVRLPFPDYLWGQFHWLYYVLLKPWTAFAGTSEPALRAPSALGTALSCVLLVVLARRLFDPRVAVVSGLLLATSPFMVKWSQQARSYTFLVAVTLVATLLLLRALERRSRSAWLTYGLAVLFVIFVQPVAALVVVPAHAVLCYQERRRLVRHALIALAPMILLGVPWMFIVSIWTADFWLEQPSVFGAVRTMAAISGAAGIGIPLAVLGLVMLLKRGQIQPAAWVGVWAFAPFALAALISLEKPLFLDRYLISAAPAFALLGGVAIMGLASRARVIAVSVVVLATALGLYQWYAYESHDNWRGENWEGAVQMIVDRRTDEPIVVIPWWAAPAARYYGAPATDTSTARSVWVLYWSERGHELPAEVRRPLGLGQHHLVEMKQFGWRVSAQLWRRD